MLHDPQLLRISDSDGLNNNCYNSPILALSSFSLFNLSIFSAPLQLTT